MRIVFHLKYFQAGRIGGQEGVIRQLAFGLAQSPLAEGQRMFALCPPAERAAVEQMCRWDGIEPVAADESDRGMARALRRLEPDLYLCPMLVIEPPRPDCPTVAVLPDLQHETYPEFFTAEVLENRRRGYGHAVRQADLILTISEYARGTILERYPEAAPERIVAAYPGLDPAFERALAAPRGDTPERWGLPTDYLLFPANFWAHKNHSGLLAALAALRKDGVAPFLVLTGDPGSGFERVEREIERLGLEKQVRFLGRLDTADFVRLMRNARALAFPSLYEGFGLPILEAFHCGTPVLCSNAASCPEVAGDAALLADPASTDDLAAGLRRIWMDAALRSALAEKGQRRVEELASKQSFEAVRTALLRAVDEPRRRPNLLRRFFRGVRPC